MWNWAQQQLANVAGTQEPVYGPSAIQTVTEQAKETPYTELMKEGHRWIEMPSTNVETQVFYIITDHGEIVTLQLIYSNVMGMSITSQFVTKILYPRPTDASIDHIAPLWSSDPLEELEFTEDKLSLTAKHLSITLNDSCDEYHIKSSTNQRSISDVTFKRTTPAIAIGKDGTSYFGTDHANPWGKMSHNFWPFCEVEGHILTKDGKLDVKGRGLHIHALQGMKPHHAAARWNFVFHASPRYNAIMMEYTTPPSYGSTVVNVGILAERDAIAYAGCTNTAKHTQAKTDVDADWPEPTAVEYEWQGSAKDGHKINAVLAGELGERVDRIDVMAEVPGFVKQIVSAAAGTRPYIYQFTPKMPIKVTTGEDGKVEEYEGQLFTEATFIS